MSDGRKRYTDGNSFPSYDMKMWMDGWMDGDMCLSSCMTLELYKF